MAKIYKCSICGKECSGLNGLALHNSLAHPDKPTIEGVPIRQKQLEKTVVSDSELMFDREDFDIRLQNLEKMARVGVQTTPSYQDEFSQFDRMITLFTKIALFKQLMGSGEQNSLKNQIEFQKFLDQRDDYEEEEAQPDVDPMQFLLMAFASKALGIDLSGLKIPVSQNVGGIGSNPPNPPYYGTFTGNETEVPIKNVPSDNMRLPPESEVLAMSDEDLKKLMKPHVKMAKQIKLKKELAYQSILNYYPNFPEERFDKIWNELMT